MISVMLAAETGKAGVSCRWVELLVGGDVCWLTLEYSEILLHSMRKKSQISSHFEDMEKTSTGEFLQDL